MTARTRLHALLLLAPIAACARTSPPPVPAAEARPLERIVAAVETHDRRCATPPRAVERARIAAELGITECTTEVNPIELGDCLREIVSEPCDRDFLRVPTCHVGALCGRTEEGTL